MGLNLVLRQATLIAVLPPSPLHAKIFTGFSPILCMQMNPDSLQKRLEECSSRESERERERKKKERLGPAVERIE